MGAAAATDATEFIAGLPGSVGGRGLAPRLQLLRWPAPAILAWPGHWPRTQGPHPRRQHERPRCGHRERRPGPDPGVRAARDHALCGPADQRRDRPRQGRAPGARTHRRRRLPRAAAGAQQPLSGDLRVAVGGGWGRRKRRSEHERDDRCRRSSRSRQDPRPGGPGIRRVSSPDSSAP